MNKSIIACLPVAVLLFLLPACGQKEEVTVNTSQYEAAIREFCKSRSMDMKVSSFEKVDEKADTATAVCKMESAEMSGPKVTWVFNFKKEGGKWKAVSQETKK